MRAKLSDVAKLAGVSCTTAFRALNGKDRIKKETVNRVMEAAKELNYKPNKHASALRSKNSKAIGVLFSNLFSGHFYAQIFKGIEDYAIEKKYAIFLGSSDENPIKENNYIKLLIEHQVDGIISAPLSPDNIGIYKALRLHGIPIVFVDKYLTGFPADRVVSDNVEGGRLAAQYLYELGHRKIAVCKGYAKNASSIRYRGEGFESALKEYGLKVVCDISYNKPLDYSREYSFHATKQLLDKGRPDFTAVFAFTDSLAMGCYSAFFQSGLSIPEDVSIIGYNDDDFTRFFVTPLTTVAQPKYEMGRQAADLLFEKINGDSKDNYKEIVLQPAMVARSSCKKIH